ncbi:MAG TPA: LysM peptidoglycan-binding domain-containing protein [Jiangellaceae bacterium]|nr:LysM peptidoglycan-binding domain-containing protein [Jiangellaceae bacterium]
MRTIKGLAALLTIGLMLIGLPAALILLGGNPLPDALPASADELWFWLTTPAGADLYISAVTVIGWIAWASITIPILMEVPATIRGTGRPRLPGLQIQQKLARGLVGAVVLMITAGGITTTAYADTGQAATAADASPATTISAPAEPSTAAANNTNEDDQTAESKPREHARYTVEAGDSLWSIAEAHLDDGTRWLEIAELNYGRTQPDGRSLQPGSQHWLERGWELLLPIPAENSPATEPAERSYTVQAGDSLWSIAETQLGDGNKWPEILDASTHINQGDGQQLTDPDLIQPGWMLTIPGDTAPVPETPAEPTTTTAPENEERPADEQPATPTEEQAEPATPAPVIEDAAPEQGAGQVTTPDQDTNDIDTEQTEQGWPVRTIGGAGGLLAVGVLGLLAAKRARTQAHRRPGRRLSVPDTDPGTSLVETRLRAIADPIGLDAVDTTLRDLAAWHQQEHLELPHVRAARLTEEEFQLYLATPATLPAPWRGTADQRIWTIDADRIDQRTTTTDLGTAPYPSLVTLGHDEENAHLLLDLEHAEHLDLRGNPTTAHDTLAALAVELATSPWADDLQVTLVGTLPDLANTVDTGRIRYVSGLGEVLRELEKRAETVTSILTNVGAEDLSQARGRGVAEDAWTPEILLVGTQLAPEARERLDELVSRVPRVGIAAVTADAHTGQWTLDLDEADSGVLEPAGLRVRPQMLTASEYTQILTVLAAAEETVPGPEWAAGLETIDEPALDEVPITVTVDDIDIHLQTAEDDSAEPAELDEEQEAEPHPGAEDDARDHDEAAAAVHTLHRPVIEILGAVELDGARGTGPASKDTVQALELLAYLALHPGVDHKRLSADLWPGREPTKATRNSAISRARRWLGTDPATGDPYLPLVGDDGLYHLDPAVTTDWAQLLELVGDDITTTPTHQLTEALNLVRSHPFDRERPGQTRIRANRFLWADPYAHEIASTIVDIARETARRALLAGEAITAETATRTGLKACQEQFHDESLWRYLIRAAWAQGDHEETARIVDQLHTALDDHDADPETDTVDLIDQIRATTAADHHRPAAI